MSELHQRLTHLPPSERGKLLALLREDRDGARQTPLRARGSGIEAPLSSAQRTLWFLDRLTSGTNAYNLVHYYRITGDLNVEALREALRALVRRQQILRTCLRENADGPIQIVVPEVPVELAVVDHTGGLDDCLDRARREVATDRIPLDRAPLWRTGLYRCGADEHLFVFAIHHAVFDGASERIFCAELAELYRAQLTKTRPMLPELTVQYSDFAHWQQERLAEDEIRRLTDLWREELDGVPELRLPHDRPRPAEFSYRGQSMTGPLPADVPDAVDKLAKSLSTTTFVVYLAAFWVLLHQYTGQRDLVVGTSVSGRGRAQLAGLLGFFINIVPLRGHLADDAGFRDTVQQAETKLRTAVANSDLPFERVVHAVAPERRMDSSPLFQVTFATAPGIVAPELAGTKVEQLFLDHGSAQFDMAWAVVQSGQPVTVVQFNDDIFVPATITAMIEHYGRLVGWLVEHPDSPLHEAPAPG
ncbi:condensation domain-containing protein [Amycolatopsis sp. cmx-11-12]|uniref:condensation domain-containing protein n=1 Tax=Amycolatopsis sp. cmx-11-12 TaxID=2785795 RepID=UPI0039174E1B